MSIAFVLRPTGIMARSGITTLPHLLPADTSSRDSNANHLLLFLLTLTTILLLLRGLGLLPSDTARTSTTKRRGKGEVDVLLGVETDDERWDVDDLLSDAGICKYMGMMFEARWSSVPDVSLANENTSVVDGLGQTELVHASLQATLQEILNLKGKDVIELHARLVEDTDTDQTANEGIAFEQTLGVLLLEGKKLTVDDYISQASHCISHIASDIPSSTTNLGQRQLNAPHLTLVA